MKIKDIAIVEENLLKLKIKNETLENMNAFLCDVNESKGIQIYSGNGESLWDAYGLFGEEIIKLVENKMINIKNEIHNFTLDQLLPIENNGLGIKFKNKRYDSEMYYKQNCDQKYATISWYDEVGNVKNAGIKSHTIEECEYFFKTGTWIKL